MWPDIPYPPWRETCTALHLYTQVVGKYRLARTPWINHSWHAAFYVNARGLTTSLVPDGPGGIEVVFDLIDHAVIGVATDGHTARFALGPMSVDDFYARSRPRACARRHAGAAWPAERSARPHALQAGSYRATL